MNDVVRSLLKAIRDGDCDSAPILADKLEELGEARAADVHAYLAEVRAAGTSADPGHILNLFPDYLYPPLKAGDRLCLATQGTDQLPAGQGAGGGPDGRKDAYRRRRSFHGVSGLQHAI